MLRSNFYKINDVLVVNLEKTDLKNKKFLIDVQSQLNNQSIQKIVIDLVRIETIMSSDMVVLEKMDSFFKLNQVSAIFCGINVSSASLLFHFIEECRFKTTLDIEQATDAHQSN